MNIPIKLNFTAKFTKILLYECRQELRRRLSILSIALYICSISYLLYFLLATQGATVEMEVKYWNVLFWVVILFTIIQNAISQFGSESDGIYLYYYTLIKPEDFILGKICYAILYAIVLNLITYLAFSIWFGSPVMNHIVFLMTMILCSISFSILFTLMAAISRGLQNQGVLTAILGFPLSIPLISLVAKLAREAYFIETSERLLSQIAMLVGFDILMLVLAVILYPFLWRE